MSRERVTDLVVVVPGILGSCLSKDGKQVWGPSASALWTGLRSHGESLRSLKLPEGIGDDHPGDGISPTGLMPNLHLLPGVNWPAAGYSALLDWLERSFTVSRAIPGAGSVPNLIPFAYDWRLSNRFNARQLGLVIDEALGKWRDSAPDRSNARVIVICHSMGGLVARYWAEVLGGAAITRSLITLGTPHQGSLDALLTLVNGHKVGPIDMSAFTRSLPSLHQLVANYRCIQTADGLARPHEFAGIPGTDETLLASAGTFHEEIETAALSATVRLRLLPVVGRSQPTAAAARFVSDVLVPDNGIDGRYWGGDGRVPWFAGRPFDWSTDDDLLSPAERHGTLHNNAGVRDAIWTRLCEEPPSYRGENPRFRLGVGLPNVVPEAEPLRVEVTVDDLGSRQASEPSVRVTVKPVDNVVGYPSGQRQGAARTELASRGGEDAYAAVIDGLAQGVYEVRVEASGETRSAVTDFVIVEGGLGRVEVVGS